MSYDNEMNEEKSDAAITRLATCKTHYLQATSQGAIHIARQTAACDVRQTLRKKNTGIIVCLSERNE